MRPVDLIRIIRDGEEVPRNEIAHFIKCISENLVPSYQVSAFLMAVYFRGLTPNALVELTLGIRDSGRVITWPQKTAHLYIDKHSTGGVGDKVSLILAPLAAACGLKVPMISGRGLGHTGGTLDKMESIANLSTNISLEQLQMQVNGSLGVAMCGQTCEIAPADKVMYGLRDVTATVESLPLITSSILSKKLASGISGLVLDVKVGNGAFMKTKEEAVKLAEAVNEVANQVGLKLCVVFTNMSQPLGGWIGNLAEMREAVDILNGSKRYKDVTRLSVELTSEMVSMAFSMDLNEARKIVISKLESGEALAKFQALVRAQGGYFNSATQALKYERIPVMAAETGYIAAINTETLGKICMELGGGRATAEDSIDTHVAIHVCLKIGEKVTPTAQLAVVYSPKHPDTYLANIKSCFLISPDEVTDIPKLIIDKVKNY